jgi:hypothetical protein
MRALVVHYSRTAVARGTALRIADILDADVDVLVDHLEEYGLLGWRRRSLARGVLAVVGEPRDVSRYDVVIVGAGVADAAIPKPVHAFLAEDARRARALALFCMTGGACGPRALQSMARVARRIPIATLPLTRAEAEGVDVQARIQAFATGVRDGLSALPGDEADCPLVSGTSRDGDGRVVHGRPEADESAAGRLLAGLLSEMRSTPRRSPLREATPRQGPGG